MEPKRALQQKMGYFGGVVATAIAERIYDQLQRLLEREPTVFDCMEIELQKFALNHPGNSWKVTHKGTDIGMIRYRTDDVEIKLLYSQFTD